MSEALAADVHRVNARLDQLEHLLHQHKVRQAKLDKAHADVVAQIEGLKDLSAELKDATAATREAAEAASAAARRKKS